MPREAEKKRYVVTYSDPQISKEEVSNLLNIAASQVEDGISVMESDREITAADVVHFDNLGTTVVSLTEKQKEELAKKENVLEVIEDFEMHILDAFETNGESQLTDSISYGELDSLKTADPTSQQMYMLGYNDGYKAMQDKLQGLLEGAGRETETETVPAPVSPILKPAPVTAIPTQPVPWNIKMVKAPGAWPRTRGLGTKVAVIDTGIATHPDLIISGGASFVPGVVSFNDDNGHGTHCAGIVGARNNFIGVIGVAPQTSLYAVKVLNSAGSGAFSQIIAGMAWSLQNKMHVVSMSLGASVATPPVALVNAVNQLLGAGITIVAAAGNSFGTSFPFVGTPANIPGVIAVGAVNQAGVIAPFSSRGGTGNQVTLSAPGVSINSTFLGNSYKVLSGTSMACPHVAGAVALIKAKFPTLTPAQIRTKLRTTATDLGVPGTDTTYGAGLLNCDAATI